MFKEDKSGNGGVKGARYYRTYTWNEKNLLVSSVDANYNTAYVYGQDGQRSNKYTQYSETLYFNKMWTLHTDSGNNVYGGQSAKNIYLGETRIVTKLNSGENPTYQEEYYKQYYYHSDHLGSASLISDYKGDEYQRIEYTPYGETWVEKTQNTGLEFLPYRFTGKEIDEETGLYYYGARYLDPKYSRWLSTDPALTEYMSGSVAGEGGIFNSINMNVYHYTGNNPVKYIDADGQDFYKPVFHQKQNDNLNRNLYMGTIPSGKYYIDDDGNKIYTKRNTIGKFGCLFTEIYNNALSERKLYCNQHNIPFNATELKSYASLDKYFSYYDHANDQVNPYNESDANMTMDTMKNLFEDISGKKVNHILKIDKKSTISVLLNVIKNSDKQIKVIGHCNGHFFTITDISENGSLDIEMIHDPQLRTNGNKSWYEKFDKTLKTNGIDAIWLID